MRDENDDGSSSGVAARRRALQALVREAQVDLHPADRDWSDVEARLSDHVARNEPAVPSPSAPSAGGGPATPSWARLGYAAAAALAAAASVAFLWDRAEPSREAAPRAAAALASALRDRQGDGEIRIAGQSAAPGQLLREGDLVEADRARAVFEREGRVAWLLEDANPLGLARARVSSAGEPLILVLEQGAIEAEVTPVPSGEAFAVDVLTDRGAVRIAVHGTHLRVARAGQHVIVDLTQGVIAIGPPPAAGLTTGTTVHAPAHVEMDVNDVPGTLRVDASSATVRTAVGLGASIVAEVRPEAPPPHAHQVGARPSSPRGAVTKPDQPSSPPRAPVAKQSARDAVAGAIRDCAALQAKHGEIRITVKSALVLHVTANGAVENARFDPPLHPEIQACAAKTIYATRFEEATPITIPIEFSY